MRRTAIPKADAARIFAAAVQRIRDESPQRLAPLLHQLARRCQGKWGDGEQREWDEAVIGLFAEFEVEFRRALRAVAVPGSPEELDS